MFVVHFRTLSELEEIIYEVMMMRFIILEKIIVGIYDDRLLINIVKSAIIHNL